MDISVNDTVAMDTPIDNRVAMDTPIDSQVAMDTDSIVEEMLGAEVAVDVETIPLYKMTQVIHNTYIYRGWMVYRLIWIHTDGWEMYDLLATRPPIYMCDSPKMRRYLLNK